MQKPGIKGSNQSLTLQRLNQMQPMLILRRGANPNLHTSCVQSSHSKIAITVIISFSQLTCKFIVLGD